MVSHYIPTCCGLFGVYLWEFKYNIVDLLTHYRVSPQLSHYVKLFAGKSLYLKMFHLKPFQQGKIKQNPKNNIKMTIYGGELWKKVEIDSIDKPNEGDYPHFNQKTDILSNYKKYIYEKFLI